MGDSPWSMLAYRRCVLQLLTSCFRRVPWSAYAGMKRTIMTGQGGDSEGSTEPKRVKDEGHSDSVVVPELESASKVASDGELELVARGGKRKEKKKKERQFDWSLYNKRHVALKLAYLGSAYHGFAIQEETGPTIESELFKALECSKLVENVKTAQYFKCGRTDKGVSALSQVISLHLRSNLLSGPGVITLPESRAEERKGIGEKNVELPYVQILNRLLPADIRVLSWAPVGVDFNARFSCLYRTYKYFFPRGTMDVERLQMAVGKFVGEHDFRNFCKLDTAGEVTHHRRRVLSFEVQPLSREESPFQMLEATVSGQAFLWHQVRCMMAVAFLVGLGLEEPEVIDHMLDVVKCPRKPQYGMAAALPLILFDCGYEGLSWQDSAQVDQRIITHLQEMWTSLAVQSTMVSRMLDTLTASHQQRTGPSGPDVANNQLSAIMSDRILQRSYKPLLTRPSAGPVEERLAVIAKRKAASHEERPQGGKETFAEEEGIPPPDQPS